MTPLSLANGDALAKLPEEKIFELEETMRKTAFEVDIVDYICLFDG